MRQNNRLIYMISAVAALSGLLFGYDTGVISGAILFIKHGFNLVSRDIEWVVSAVLLGALFGSGLSGKVTDRFGRRPILLLTALLFIVGSMATALAPDMAWLFGGRILLGVAIGIGSFTAPLYLAEIAPIAICRLLVSLNQLAITVGIVMAYLVNYCFAAKGNWSWMLGLGVVPAVTLLFLPESPRWLLLIRLRSTGQQCLATAAQRRGYTARVACNAKSKA